jgi:hypothetical protein
MNTVPQQVRSDAPKVPRRLHERSQNEHRIKKEKSWRAESAEMVARVASENQN